MEEKSSKWWWLESHKSSKQSLWLQSTLSELDGKTKSMLMLIEGNADDSFAQRAETYYKKRPELITFVQDFYRAHRSLAERFDHFLRSSSSSSSDNASRSSSFKIHQQQEEESLSDSNSHFEDDADSEIEDPPDHHDEQLEHNKHEDDDDDETLKLEQERLKKLIQETDALRKELLAKDEEKREVIRQLSLTLQTLKDDNLSLKRRLLSLNKRSVFDFKPLDNLFGKLFSIICDSDDGTTKGRF